MRAVLIGGPPGRGVSGTRGLRDEGPPLLAPRGGPRAAPGPFGRGRRAGRGGRRDGGSPGRGVSGTRRRRFSRLAGDPGGQEVRSSQEWGGRGWQRTPGRSGSSSGWSRTVRRSSARSTGGPSRRGRRGEGEGGRGRQGGVVRRAVGRAPFGGAAREVPAVLQAGRGGVR